MDFFKMYIFDLGRLRFCIFNIFLDGMDDIGSELYFEKLE